MAGEDVLHYIAAQLKELYNHLIKGHAKKVKISS